MLPRPFLLNWAVFFFSGPYPHARPPPYVLPIVNSNHNNQLKPKMLTIMPRPSVGDNFNEPPRPKQRRMQDDHHCSDFCACSEKHGNSMLTSYAPNFAKAFPYELYPCPSKMHGHCALPDAFRPMDSTKSPDRLETIRGQRMLACSLVPHEKPPCSCCFNSEQKHLEWNTQAHFRNESHAVLWPWLLFCPKSRTGGRWLLMTEYSIETQSILLSIVWVVGLKWRDDIKLSMFQAPIYEILKSNYSYIRALT